MIYNGFLLSQYTECAHILEDVQSASCDAATRFSGVTQMYINVILLKDSWQSVQVSYIDFLLQ